MVSTKFLVYLPTMRNPADVRMLWFIASFFAGVGFLWNFAATAPLWVSIPVYLWVGLMAMVGAVMNHNALHCPIFREWWANRMVQILLTFIYGMPVTVFIPVHNLSHHKHAQTAKDVTRSMKLRSNKNWINVLRAASTIGPDALVDDIKYFAQQYKKGSPIVGDVLVEAACLVAYAVCLIKLDWLKFIFLGFLPWQLSQTFIVGINYVQHDGCDQDQDGWNHSRNFTGTWFNYFFLNNGFHTIHHRMPGLHWSRAPDTHKRVVAPHMHPNLDISDGFSWGYDYFVSPGTRRTYLGEPYTPPALTPDEPWGYETSETYSAGAFTS